MAKFVPDVKTNRWVIITPARVDRPHDNTPFAEKKCPFCPGTENLNKELFRIDSIASLQNDVILEGVKRPIGSSNWLIRVIANKYPITDYHEVIIHSSDHERDFDELPVEQVKLILQTLRQRYNYNRQFGTVMIFNNHDIHAGASLKHPHSQLVVVPKQINLDTMQKEPVQNEVTRTDHFVAYCPDFSQWPYEIWIAPQSSSWRPPAGEPIGSSQKDAIASLQHDGNDTFGSITDDQISDLAPLLQKILKIIVNRFRLAGRNDTEQDIPYNFYIYHGTDWYLRIIPRLIHRAGFELGTGLSVNIVDPLKAAEEYRMSFRA